MQRVQPPQSCDLFSYLYAPGATDAYWNLLDGAAQSIATTDNCVISRFYAVGALVQVPLELVLATLNGIKSATLNAVCAFLACDGNKGMELVKEGFFAVVHAVKLVVALPFLFLAAITAWPREVVEGLAKTNPHKEVASLDDAIKLSNTVALMTGEVEKMTVTVNRLVTVLEASDDQDNSSEAESSGSLEHVPSQPNQ